MLPTTAGEAHDLLQRMFGIGSYDEVASGGEYWKARGLEVGKIKGIMRRRRVKPEDLGKAAWLAQTRGVHVASVMRLLPLVTEAIKEWEKADAEEVREQALEQLHDIVDEAIAAGDDEFAGRLLRADQASAQQLIEQWRSR